MLGTGFTEPTLRGVELIFEVDALPDYVRWALDNLCARYEIEWLIGWPTQ